MSNGQLTPRRAADPDNQTNGKWCSADATPEFPGGTCGNYPIRGGNVCKRSHGGAAPQVMRKAAEREKEQEAEKALAKFKATSLASGRMQLSNVDALLWMVEEAALNVTFYQDKIQRLRQGKTEKNEAGEYEEGLYSFVPMVGDIEHVWVRKYDQERDRLVKYASDCLKIGIEAKKAEIAQEQGQQMMRALIASWDALNLTQEQRDIARNVVASELREFRVIQGG